MKPPTKDCTVFAVHHSVTLTQKADCESEETLDNIVTAKTVGDCTGGHFLILETERWALDHTDIDKFCDWLKSVLKTAMDAEKKEEA